MFRKEENTHSYSMGLHLFKFNTAFYRVSHPMDEPGILDLGDVVGPW
jgi:hypothetical protein